MSKSVKAEIGVPADSIDRTPDSRADRITNLNEKATLRTWLVFALVVPMICMAPLLFAQSKRLISEQTFLFFPLSIAIGIGFLVRTCAYRPASFRRARLSEFLYLIGVGLLVVGIFWYSPLIVQFAAIVVLLAWSLGAFGGSSWTRIVAICSLFAVTAPLPSGFDSRIAIWLQSISSWACNGFLDAISIPNILEGDSLQVGAMKISVSGVCGGADSLNALIAAVLAVVVYRRSTLLVGVLTIATAPVVLVIGNIVRLLAIAIGMEYFGIDLSTGIGHIAIATAVFGAVLVCMLLFHFAIDALVEPIADLETKNILTQWFIRFSSWPQEATSNTDHAILGSEKTWSPSFLVLGLCCLACALFGSLSVYALFFSVDNNDALQSFTVERAAAFPSKDALPDELNGIRMIGFDTNTNRQGNSEGKFSHAWKFDDRGNQIFVSLDFPFRGWRRLREGYQSFGWKIIDTKESEQLTTGGTVMAIDEFKMQNQYGLLGFVWYAFFDEHGIPIERSTASKQPSRKNIFSMFQNDHNEEPPVSFQVQVFFESGRELNKVEMERNRNLFSEIFERIRQESEITLQKARQARK